MITATWSVACALLAASAAPAPDGPAGAAAVNHHRFEIPINVDPGRQQSIRRLELYVSTDQGKHWDPESCAGPSDGPKDCGGHDLFIGEVVDAGFTKAEETPVLRMEDTRMNYGG